MKAFISKYLILCSLLLIETGLSAGEIQSIEKAATMGLIQVAFNSRGGHLGDVMEMKIKNKTSRELSIKLESGRILDSKNQAEQDIIVTREQAIYIIANEEITLSVLGMCAEAHKGAPTEDAIYTLGGMADSNLIRLTQFIDKNKYHNSMTAQQAVWTITDTCSLASIKGGTEKEVSIFKNLVSKITGRSIPNYGVTYRRQNSRDLMGKAIKIEGIFDYNLTENCRPTLAIYNSEGKLVQLIFENIFHQKGKNELYYTFKTADLPSGVYYARMKINEHLFKEIPIEF